MDRTRRPRLVRSLLLVALAGVSVAPSVGCEDWRRLWNRKSLEQNVEAMRDPIFPDERRSGIAGIQRRDELREGPYQAEFRTIARADSHPSVRAQATRALNQGRDDEARPVFMALLNDPEPKVRLEAVKGLRNLPDERAIPRLTELANDDRQDRDVRIWAVAALGSYRRLEVARSLVPLLDARDFGVAHEARWSLRRMTGRDYKYEQGTWLRFLTTSPAPFAGGSTPPALPGTTRPAN